MRAVRMLILVAVLLFAHPSTLMAVPVAVDTTRLSQGEPGLDGKTVRFSGEAIGEALRAGGDSRWLNVLEGAVAIGVFTSQAGVEGIDGYGYWGRTGSIVEITGVYNVACEQHGGDLDVHATGIRVLRDSVPRSHPVHPAKALAALFAAGVAAALVVRYRSVRRRVH